MVKKPILACGADLKGAFCLATGEDAVYSGSFGDLSDPDNYAAYEKAVKDAEKKFNITPKVIAYDMHPFYFSSRFAEEHSKNLIDRRLVKVQHHEAHIAGVLADNAVKGDVIGVAFDGTGFGRDGAIWGGEIFVGSAKGFKRVAHLSYTAMPGGEAAIRQPWRMAVSYLYRAYGKNLFKADSAFLNSITKRELKIIIGMIEKKINSPETSSMGRFFDAASALILKKKKAEYEAELPIKLEKAAARGCADEYGFDIKRRGGVIEVEPDDTIKGIIKDMSGGVKEGFAAAKFHNTAAAMIEAVSSAIKRKHGVNKVVFGGGVFQNRYLSERAELLLRKKRFTVYRNVNIPVNDEGIALGQVAIANEG